MTSAIDNEVKVNGKTKDDQDIDTLVAEANERAARTQSMLDNLPFNVLMANTSSAARCDRQHAYFGGQRR